MEGLSDKIRPWFRAMASDASGEHTGRTPGSFSKVRKNLSRSNSECEIHGSRRRKPCGTARSVEGFCTIGSDSMSGGNVAPELPLGLLSCLSMLELSKLDSSSDAGSGVPPQCSAYHRRVPSRTGSVTRLGSAGTMGDILARIRVPSQRAAMAEMAAAAERVETQRLTRGSSTPWCQAPTRHSSWAGHRRTSSAGSLGNLHASTLEMDVAQLDAVLRSDAEFEPPIPFADTIGHTARGTAAAEHPVSSRPGAGRREEDAATASAAMASCSASSTHPSRTLWFALDSCGPSVSRAEAHAAGRSTSAPPLAVQSAGQAGNPVALPLGANAQARVKASQPAAPLPVRSLCSAAGLPPAPPPVLAASRPHLVPTAFQWIPVSLTSTGAAAAVYLCGTFNNWEERLPMHRKAGHRGEEWWIVLNLRPGEYAYKFVVHRTDGHVDWQHAPDQPSLVDAHGHSNNWICVLDQHAYEQEELGMQSHSAEDEQGYTQDVAAEFAEMLFATEPPSIPACLPLEPPLGGIHWNDEPPPARSTADGIIYNSHVPSPFHPLLHSSLHHVMTACSATAREWLSVTSSPTPCGCAMRDAGSLGASVERSRELELSSCAAGPPLPPPVSSQMTMRCRDKFVTIEFVRAGTY